MEDVLYHHGILGQKWGIRRYQNEDGSLTNAGKKRYGDDDDTKLENNHKSRRQIKLEEEYKKEGLTQKEAEIQAHKKIRTEKIYAIATGSTVAAVAGFSIIGKKYMNRPTTTLWMPSHSLYGSDHAYRIRW